MMRTRFYVSIWASLVALTAAASVASAATSITNSLTGFTGDSTQATTQNALAAVGLGFTSTEGAVDVNDPTVGFDSSGAHFGDFIAGDGGRNFIRTTDADFANYSFTADVTWVTNDYFATAAYFGLGSGEYAQFRIADYNGPFAAAQLFLELNGTPPRAFTIKNNNSRNAFDDGVDVTGNLDTTPGVHRLRMTYDWFKKTADFAIDANYTGGPFTADVTLPTLSTVDLYGPGGWPSEPSRFYFGGDDGTAYKDLNITLTSGNMVFGDFTGDGLIKVGDWVVLRNSQLADLSAMTFQQAYAAGDLNADKANNQADFAIFKAVYEQQNGPGSFAAIANVPEPSTFLVMLSAGLGVVPALRQARQRA